MEFNKIRLFQLQKQNLIRKVEAGDYSKLLKDHIGLHSTDYLTPYLSLWARVENFDPKALFNDLNDHRKAIRLRAFRGTVFVIHKDNLKDILGGLKVFLSSTMKEFEKFLSKVGENLDSIEQEVVTLLSNSNELTVNELKKELAGHLPGEYFTYASRYLEFKGILVRTNHRYITDRVIRYGLMQDWDPEIVLSEINPDQALETLILKYIKKFGPICLDDLCWWIPITKTLARKILENLRENLIFFDFNSREYFLEKNDYDKLEDFELLKNYELIINFLPYEDHFPKAYFIRNWFLSAENSPLVYKKGIIYRGQIFPSIWLNGEIIGSWKLKWVDKAKSAMKVEVAGINLKRNISQKITQLIEGQKRELEDFVNEKLVPLMSK